MSGFQGYDQWKTASPYDFEECAMCNCDLAAAFPDFESPYDLYRGVYKGTDCGATVGFHALFAVYGDNGDWGPNHYIREQWFYNTDLRDLPRFDQLEDLADRAGPVFDAISVSSIVEGVEQETEKHIIELDVEGGDEPEAIAKEFWAAVEAVEQEAAEIWDATHGMEEE